MWLSKQVATKNTQADNASLGVVTLSDVQPAVVTDTEQRQLQLLAPGGYCWRPAVGDGVLVIKDAGGSLCASGVTADSPVDLAPGEICLHAGSASIYLDRSGKIYLSGTVYVNGVPYGGTTDGE